MSLQTTRPAGGDFAQIVTGVPTHTAPCVLWESGTAEHAAPVYGETARMTPATGDETPNGAMETTGYYDLVLTVALTAGTSVDVAVYVWDAALENYVWRKTVTVTATQRLDPIDLGVAENVYVAAVNLVGSPTFSVTALARA